MTRGFSVAAGLLLRARGSVSWQRSLRSAPSGDGRLAGPRRGNGHGCHVRPGRRARCRKDTVTVCLRAPGAGRGRRAETRTFKTTFGSLRVMRDWLVDNGVEVAAIESTLTCWKPPYLRSSSCMRWSVISSCFRLWSAAARSFVDIEYCSLVLGAVKDRQVTLKCLRTRF